MPGWMRWAVWLLALTVAMTSALDEDLQFEETNAPNVTPAPVRRLWGIPDMQAVVGKLFLAAIPDDAFSGEVQFYEAGGRDWPRWLTLTQKGELRGVPTSGDVGTAFLMVRAVGPHAHHYSKDIFAIDVIKPGLDTILPHALNKGECPTGMDPLMLTIVVNAQLRSIMPARRVNMIETIAAFYAVDTDGWYLREVAPLRDDPTVVDAGSGNVKVPENQNSAALSIQIGCGKDVRAELATTASRVSSDAQDGTLAEVLQLPIARWYTHTELPTFFRDRREVGSGDFDRDDEEEDYGEGEGVTVGLGTVTSQPHPHRHHHGDGDDDNAEGTANGLDTDAEVIEPSEVFYQRPASTLLMNYDNIISTPAYIPERPSVVAEVPSTVSIVPTIAISPTATVSPSSIVTPSRVTNQETDSTFTFETDLTSAIIPKATGTDSDSSEDDDFNFTSGTSAPTLPVDLSSSVSSSVGSSPSSTHREDEFSLGSMTTQLTTEDLEPEDKNFHPAIGQRPQKVQIFAGSSLRLQLPENTFTDVEDGSMSHLSVKLTTMDGRELPADSWIMYNASLRQVLAVTWEQHVQAWEFLLTATDKDGDSVSDTIPVHVQQHKRVRSVNHEFSISVRLDRGAFAHAVEWQLQLLSALAKVYGDTDSNRNIVVRGVNIGPVVSSLTWTNDSLPHDRCPQDQIDQLFKVISDGAGDATSELSTAVGPNMTITSVSYRLLMNCEPVKEVGTPAPPLAPAINYPPQFRNQVDQINATAGEFYIYRVPEDALYDPEDGGTRQLKMTLLQSDRSPLNPKHWLQFDEKNQEFFGLPMDKDVRSSEFQLMCEDPGGLSATDNLLVVVRPRHHRQYSVEFSIVLDVPFDKFQSSPLLKRKFIEKLQMLFGDASTKSIVVNSVTQGGTADVTTVKWHNSSLPTDRCPEEQIYHLRKKISSDDGRITKELVDALGNDLQVVSVGLEPEGACQGELTVLHEPPPAPAPGPGDSSRPITADDYLLTYVIPIAIIVVMLCLAGLVACLLYRKRHVAKLGAGDEAERHSFRSKGIPVIFQDELEEKPEPEIKPPVIMKEEKPPLPPPEYQRGGMESPALGGEDTPYHPPPPFPASRDSTRSARPKPTPTYRKPPPYVPP